MKEPRKVIVRKYGGNIICNMETLKPLSKTEELVLLSELRRRNLAPKLFGFFEGGRIEEFIDAHPITEKEVSNPVIESDIARNLARIHSVDTVPFPRPGYDFRNVLRNHYQSAEENIAQILNNNHLLTIQDIIRHDWKMELDWLSRLLQPEDHRVVLMHWDTHLQNIGVMNTPLEGALRTIIYDYEMSSYNIRGKDIGLFLLSKSGLLGAPDMDVTDCIKFPSVDECKSFVTKYMAECKLLFEDWNEKENDSFDHIMMEAMIGGMVSSFCFLFLLVNNHDTLSKISPNNFEKTFKGLNNCYLSCKSSLQNVFPNYAAHFLNKGENEM